MQLERTPTSAGAPIALAPAAQALPAARADALAMALSEEAAGSGAVPGPGTDRPRPTARERSGVVATARPSSDRKPGDAGEAAAVLAALPDLTGSPGESGKPASEGSSGAERSPLPLLPWSAEAFDELRAALSAEGRRLRLDLDPDDLGRLSVQLELVEENIRASLVAESESTLALLDAERGVLDRLLGGRAELRFDLAPGGDDSQRGARRDLPPNAEAQPTRATTRTPAESERAPEADPLASSLPRHAHHRISVRA